MKCPKCKNPSNLQTKRTMANGKEVSRDRYCQKCRGRFVTVERFSGDIAEADLRHERKIGELQSNNLELQRRLEEYADLFRGLKVAMDNSARKR